MLQRRIGMIWTSSGCAVSVRPRANSRSDRALRLTQELIRIVVVRTLGHTRYVEYASGVRVSGRRRRLFAERPSPKIDRPE